MSRRNGNNELFRETLIAIAHNQEMVIIEMQYLFRPPRNTRSLGQRKGKVKLVERKVVTFSATYIEL